MNKRITIDDYSYGIIKRTCESVYSMLSRPTNTPDDFENYLDNDACEHLSEVGEIIFSIVIGPEGMATIDALRNPPEPEPEPLPIPGEFEELRYCLVCQKPRIFTRSYYLVDENDEITGYEMRCATCGRTTNFMKREQQ